MSRPQYGPSHRKERERWKVIVAAGEGMCARCNRPIGADEPFHLSHDHVAGDGSYEGIAHPSCNLGEKNSRNARERRYVAAAEDWTGFLGPGGECWSRRWVRYDGDDRNAELDGRRR